MVIDIITGDYIDFSGYNNSLKREITKFSEFDVNAVYHSDYIGNSMTAIKEYIEDNKEPEWTWERNEYILDKQERRYLKSVIRPFKDKVNFITKKLDCTNKEKEYICINFGDEYTSLPDFDKDKYYKNMEAGRNYTIQELRLFD